MLLLTWLACSTPSPPQPAVVDLDPPAAEGAHAPALATDGDRAWLAWIEPSAEGQQLRVAALEGGRWGEAHTIADGPSIVANWADPPRLARDADDALVVAFPVATAARGYDLHLARSTDAVSWARLGPANADGTPTEHGFPSVVPGAEGTELVWLDGRATAQGGATSLRRASIGDGIGADEIVDDRVCDCCGTDAVAVGDSLAVAYRDRAEDERRDIRVAVRSAGAWRTTEVSRDGWQVGGCPVNGPALEAAGGALAVAWYTGAPAPEVRLAWSFDDGASFDPPYAVDVATPASTPLGRVDLVAVGEDVVVSWARTDGDDVTLLAQRYGPNGRTTEPFEITSTRASNLTGFPRLGRADDQLLLTWAEVGPPGRVRVRGVPTARLGETSRQARRSTTAAIATPLPDMLPDLRVVDEAGRPGPLAPDDRPTFVNVWASWCRPCLAELPEVAALSASWGDQVAFVGLAVDDRPERVAAAAREAGALFPQRHVDAASARQAFGSPQVPASYLFDADGRLVWSTRDRIPDGDPALEAALRRVTDQASP